MADQDGGGFIWFLAGLGIGGLIGVLYAPKAGVETREELKAKAQEGRDYVRNRARDVARDVQNQASEWVDKSRDVVTQQKDQFRAAYEAGRQAYQEATSEAAASKTS
jgi:gas vesicle protein